MPCGCNKRKQATLHVWIDDDMNEHPYPTEVEAKAAQIRGGGGGHVVSKAKT